MLAFVAGSFVVPALARRMRPETAMAGGLVLGAIGFALLAQVQATGTLGILILGSVIYALGLSPVVILATAVIVGSAPPERAGAASAISETSSELGGALGIAILGSIGTAIYRSAIVIPAAIPPAAAAAARGTLGGAIAAAEQLPEDMRATLVEPARLAFLYAFHTTAWICAATALLLALVTAWRARLSARSAVS
jgi:DHA2 family multidrug resistance protein-like MFS transporter